MKNYGKRKMISCFLSLALAVSLATGLSFASMAADEKIIVLYTNDVHCGVDDNIGYAGLALYKKQMQKETPYVALVDAGDAIQGAPIGTLSDGGYLVDIMNKTGYDVAVPGNHEFDYGMSRFLELSGKLSCGYTACNLVRTSDRSTVFKPYQMFTYGNTKVAFVGVSTPESFTKSTPAYFQDASGNYLYSFSEDESGTALYHAVQTAVDSARAEGASYVILVGHLGENGSTGRWSSDSVLKNTSGIDVCIDGHSHETVEGKTVRNKEGKEVILTQTGTKLNNIGKLTIHEDGTISTELVSQVTSTDPSGIYTVAKGDTLSRIAKRELRSYHRWNEIYQLNRSKIKNPNVLSVGMTLVLPGSSAVSESGKAIDYDTDHYIKQLQAHFSETLKTVLGHTPFDLTINDPATGERAVRSAETNLGDLTADAYRYTLEADIGLSNGGGIRSNIKAGDISYNDTLTVFPYGNMGCLIKATGQQIKDALEMGAKNCPDESGGFLQVSGLSYTINTSIPSSLKTDDKGNFIKVEGVYRVSDILVAGVPLDLQKSYTVASHNYLLKSGGDGMNMFKDCEILKDEVLTDVDLLSQYINQNLRGNIGEAYNTPTGQNRITIK